MGTQVKLLAAISFFSALGLGAAYIIGQNGQTHGGWPVIFICALWAYGLNWAAFIPALMFKTEKYYDLIGSLTYLSAVGLALYLSSPIGFKGWIVAVLVTIWAMRLGSFLFLRIRRDKHDKRFDTIKTNPLRFLLTWTLQATWVVLTSACALAIITAQNLSEWGIFVSIGLALWLIGFSIEVVADLQKSAFRKIPENKGRFITTGLWARSQHPNYFGEILLWVGIALMALPSLSGLSWLALISPFFVMFLLLKVSGVPMLQKAGMKKWGDDPDYLAYKKNTPKLILRLTGR